MELTVRAMDKIDKFEDIRVSYLPTLFDKTQQRREILSKHYYFHCDCDNCQNELADSRKSSLKCFKCNNCVPISIRNCIECQTPMKLTLVERGIKLKGEISEIMDEPTTDTKVRFI